MISHFEATITLAETPNYEKSLSQIRDEIGF